MFDEIKELLDRYERIYKDMYGLRETQEDVEWMEDEYVFEMAKALYNYLPKVDKVAKMICVMDNVFESVKVKVE